MSVSDIGKYIVAIRLPATVLYEGCVLPERVIRYMNKTDPQRFATPQEARKVAETLTRRSGPVHLIWQVYQETSDGSLIKIDFY